VEQVAPLSVVEPDLPPGEPPLFDIKNTAKTESMITLNLVLRLIIPKYVYSFKSMEYKPTWPTK
jgi:hypothetical protein